MELQRKCVEAELQLAMALSMQLQKRLQLMEALSEILETLTHCDPNAEDALAAQAGIEALLVQPLFAITSVEAPEEAEEAAQQRQRAQQAVQGSRQQAEDRPLPHAPGADILSSEASVCVCVKLDRATVSHSTS